MSLCALAYVGLKVCVSLYEWVHICTHSEGCLHAVLYACEQHTKEVCLKIVSDKWREEYTPKDRQRDYKRTREKDTESTEVL